MHGWVMLETQRIIIKMVCWQMNVVVKSRSQRHTMCFVRFLAIISNLLVKLKTVWDNEFCLCPYIMGSADAAFVTAVPKLVVFWVCVGFSDNQTVLWPSNDLTDVGVCPLAFESSLHTQDKRNLGEEAAHVRALGENYKSKESDWILMWPQCRVCSKMMFHQSTKGQCVFQVRSNSSAASSVWQQHFWVWAVGRN